MKKENGKTAAKPEGLPVPLRTRPSRGPQPGFTRDQIAAIAAKIADEEGIEAISMRRIAADLGSGAASLYRYIKKKDELLDLMADAVLPDYTLPNLTGKWREDLRRMAFKGRQMILEHPWIIGVSAYRSSMGHNTLRWLELTLSALDDHGLDIDEMLVASMTVLTFAKGYAAGENAEREASERSGLTREQWMISRSHRTMAILETGQYPHVSRVVKDAKAPHDPDPAARGFSLGLDHILDGISLQIETHKGSRKRARSKKVTGG